MPDRTCSIDGCIKPLRSSGAKWCAMHYHRWYRHGDPLKTSRSASAPRTRKPRRYRRTTAKGQQERSQALRSDGWWGSHDTIAPCASQHRREALPIASEYA